MCHKPIFIPLLEDWPRNWTAAEDFRTLLGPGVPVSVNPVPPEAGGILNCVPRDVPQLAQAPEYSNRTQ